jgi:hypothetical protein
MTVLKKIILPLCVLALLSSCSVKTDKLMRTGSFMPNEVRLNQTMADFELLGEGEATVDYHRYLGFITHLNLINGKEVARRNQTIINFSGNGNFNFALMTNSRIRRAMYEMHIKYPTADFLVPVNIITEKQGMFLGSVVKQTMKIKAYKIKDK